MADVKLWDMTIRVNPLFLPGEALLYDEKTGKSVAIINFGKGGCEMKEEKEIHRWVTVQITIYLVAIFSILGVLVGYWLGRTFR